MEERQVVQLVYSAFRRAWSEASAPRDAPPSVVFVSEVCQCLRKSYFQRVQGLEPSGEKVVILVMGSALHYIVERFGEYDGKLAEAELRGEYMGVELRGRADLILDDCVVELKTIIKVPQQPLEHHVDQLQLYLHLSARDYGYIVYVGKKDGRVVAFRVERDGERVRFVLYLRDRGRALRYYRLVPFRVEVSPERLLEVREDG